MKTPKVAQVLSQLMTEKNIRVTELARRVKLPQPTVHRIVTGVCPHPHSSSLKPIANFFCVTVDQLRGLEPLGNSMVQHIPELDWKDVIDWPQNRSNLDKSKIIATDNEVSSLTFATRLVDSAMDPVFPKNTLLIVDPEKPPKDRHYVIAKLANHDQPLFRQLLINAQDRYLKPISPDLSLYKVTTMSNDDKILGVLIQARHNFDE